MHLPERKDSIDKAGAAGCSGSELDVGFGVVALDALRLSQFPVEEGTERWRWFMAISRWIEDGDVYAIDLFWCGQREDVAASKKYRTSFESSQ